MSRETRLTDANLALADGLHSLAIRMLRRLRAEDARTGIGPARLSVLSILVFGGSSSVCELAAAELVKLPPMSRLISGLERDGLAKRSPDERDGRAVQVKPTRRGRSLLESARRRRLAALARHFEPLSLEEMAGAREAVEILKRILD